MGSVRGFIDQTTGLLLSPREGEEETPAGAIAFAFRFPAETGKGRINIAGERLG
jgi:hypothetical protein